MKKWLAASALTLFATTGALAGNAVDDVAAAYVKLVLALGNHDAGYVDAYYGPPQWQSAAKSSELTVTDIIAQAARLRERLPAPETGKDAMARLRIDYLRTQLTALEGYAASLQGTEQRDFDREARAFYDTSPPQHELAEFDQTLAELDKLLPGEQPLHQRVDEFTRAYEIPGDKLQPVFEAAIKACRERTRKHIELQPQENFVLEYVKDKPWSGYNWYQGKAQSLIQINTSLPIRIDRAIDLGCHEGYPGHHTYNALLEKEFVDRRGWVEFSVYPLFSPQSLIAEGTANYGIELAFPGNEKTDFEARVLYPLAGLDPAGAEKYAVFQGLTSKLAFARNETARRYINGDIDREEAISLEQKYGPKSRQRAEQSVRFIDNYGAYVINYNWGKQLVAQYIENGTDSQHQRWQKFAALLASPRLPSSLQTSEQ